MTDRWKNVNCRAHGCSNNASRDIDAMAICPQHVSMIAEHLRPIFIQEARLEAGKLIHHASETQERTKGNREPSLVYYARIGDYIKIGFTTRLRSRLTTLRIDELLAIEPGGPELERERHREFVAERIDLRRENFRPSPALDAHITELRAKHALPYWASLPRTSEITTRRQEPA